MCIKTTAELTKRQGEYAAVEERHAKKVIVCCGTGCVANGAREIVEAFKKSLASRKIKDFEVEAIKETGCHGFCEQGPLVAIEPKGTFYTHVKPKDIEGIIDESIAADNVIEKHLYTDPTTGEKIERYQDVGFFSHQYRLALRHLGKIAANDIRAYIAVGGYQSLAKVLTTMTPEEVIEQVEKSGLRGRGGGGFATGRKWRTCATIESDVRYVICNGDEGDPGAFMDRSIMEGDPHAVLEGMMIAAYAIGAKQGYIYVREEYPLAVKHLRQAIAHCHEFGMLGKDILGTGFEFDIKITRGAGAFVCGESSALMKSVAGEVGEPRAKYVHSVERGLYDKPTVLNNVESYVNIPVIIDKGGEWFAKIGSPNNSGTKVFSLVGKVCNTGLIEVPMGSTLRSIVYDVGGGIQNDRPFKAVQTGGPSGGCLPAAMLDEPVDFDTLTKAGSMMGSGGMIVMDDTTCMVDVAKYFLGFLVEESCGKCVPCREGLFQLYKIVVRISEGMGEMEDLETMEKLSRMVEIGSLCGLGQSGPNPLMSTLKFFRDEYVTHIKDKKCPAGVCKSLITYEITQECTGCLACIAACAVHAITGEKGKVHVLDKEKCDRCGACYAICKYNAIEVH